MKKSFIREDFQTIIEDDINTNIENKLLKIINGWKIRPSQNKNLHQIIFSQVSVLEEDYNCKAFFITLTQSRQLPLIQQWQELPKKIELLLEDIGQQFTAVGAIISIEMHRSNTKYNKKATSVNAGFPHVHMMLWITHAFLNPTVNNLRLLLLNYQFEICVKIPETLVEVKENLLYTIKEAADANLADFCQEVIQWPANTAFWINHDECSEVFAQMRQNLMNSQKRYQSFGLTSKQPCTIPTTRRMPETCLLLAELIHKIFIRDQMVLYGDQIYRPTANAKFTWEPYIKLKLWLTGLWTEKNTSPYFLKALKSSADWIYSQAVVNSKTIQFPIFPELIIESDLVEFSDGVYNLRVGVLSEPESMSPFLSCTNYIPRPFHRSKPPFATLGFVYALMNGDQTSYNFKDKNKQHSRTTTSIEHLIAFGNLFHPEVSIKKAPGLYLKGSPSTFKTTFLKMLLEGTVGKHQIHYLGRNSARFAFGFLTQRQRIYIVVDDVIWNKDHINPGDLLNLMDRTEMQVENKHQDSTPVTFKGSIAMTSNQPIYDNGFADATIQKALQSRLHVVEFHNLKNDASEKHMAKVQEQSIFFSILCNSLFLKKHESRNFQIPEAWHSKNSDLWRSTQIDDDDGPDYGEPYEQLGFLFYQDIIKQLET